MATSGFLNSASASYQEVSQATEPRERTTEEVLGEVVSGLTTATRRLDEMHSTVGPSRKEEAPPVGIIAMAVCLLAQSADLNERLARIAERLGRL